jgi:hypothetical protein
MKPVSSTYYYGDVRTGHCKRKTGSNWKLNIIIYDVQESHITNTSIRGKMNNSLSITQMMEICKDDGNGIQCESRKPNKG